MTVRFVRGRRAHERSIDRVVILIGTEIQEMYFGRMVETSVHGCELKILEKKKDDNSMSD